MTLTGKPKLLKLKTKNKGNKKLREAIDQLIKDIEQSTWKTQADLAGDRPDADSVHPDGFYFFDIAVYRTMIMIEFSGQEATVVWADSHANYELTFKNNKNTIAKWLKEREYIS
jgi:hypothetical protein